MNPVGKWIAAFGEDNVFFLDYRELKQDPESFMKKTCEIIGVPFNADYAFENKVNSAAIGCVRSPLLMRAANVTVRFLIRNGLSGVIAAIKRSGIKKLIFKQGSQLTIPEADIEKARAYLAASTKWYNERFNTPDRSTA